MKDGMKKEEKDVLRCDNRYTNDESSYNSDQDTLDGSVIRYDGGFSLYDDCSFEMITTSGLNLGGCSGYHVTKLICDTREESTESRW